MQRLFVWEIRCDTCRDVLPVIGRDFLSKEAAHWLVCSPAPPDPSFSAALPEADWR